MHQKHQSEAVFTAEWWPLFTRANFLMHCLSLVSRGPGPAEHIFGGQSSGWRQRHNWWQLNRINNSQLLYWALWGGMLVQYFIRSPGSWDTSQTLIETRISFFWNVLPFLSRVTISQYHSIAHITGLLLNFDIDIVTNSTHTNTISLFHNCNLEFILWSWGKGKGKGST